MIERDITAADGRTLHVYEGGDPSGVPVFALSGTPAAGPPSPEDDEAARARSVRLIGYDRPGYARSTRYEGRNVADCAADVRAIAAALSVDRAALWGISGGGPHALACAALLSGLISAVAVLGSVAPYGAPGLKWLDGMGEDNVAEFEAALQGAGPCRDWLQTARDEMAGQDIDALAQAMQSLLSDVDRAAFRDTYGRHLAESLQRAIDGGVDGWLDDDLAFVSDWGFGLSQIATPVLVMHGGQDRFVPVAHGRWLAETVPGAEGRIHDDDGHLSLERNRQDELYAWLRETLG